jgi:formamidopyrimidine-DNA glycosylase
MPELPEMRALSERLRDTFLGAELKRIDVLQFSALKTVSPTPLVLNGTKVNDVSSFGKYVLMDFEPARLTLHLSQAGRMEFEDPPKATKPKGALFRFRFEDRPSVLVKEFGTERKASWWVLEHGDPGPLEGLGPEPFSEEFAELILTGDDRRRLHTMLRDQRTVAGIGRGFADDILHRAKIAPFDPLRSLDEDRRRILLETTHAVLEEALEQERKRTGGLPPKLGDRFAVHNRWGQPCPVCATEMKRVSYESYEVTYCPTCQTGGKVLADRRMSRLLK